MAHVPKLFKAMILFSDRVIIYSDVITLPAQKVFWAESFRKEGVLSSWPYTVALYSMGPGSPPVGRGY